jgi:hypothetical protein
MRRGMGDYFPAADYSWQFYPQPYRFISKVAGPGGATPDYASAQSMGLGCASCGGTCGGGCGMGQVDFSFLTNTFTVAGYAIPVWVGLMAAIGATALIYNNTKKGRR